jgi:GAF domain-containing protein
MPHSDDALNESVRALATILLGEETLDSVLARVCQLAVATVPPADHCGVTLLDRGRAATAAATDAVTLQVDGSQYRFAEGPCLLSAQTGTLVRIDDMAHDDRFPRFAADAVQLGIGASMSLPLTARGDTFGALNVYATTMHPWNDDAIGLLQQFADQASIAVANARVHDQAASLIAQLQESIASRKVIEQAVGVLVAQRQCHPDEAFAFLREASQSSNRRVRLLAEMVVDAATSGQPVVLD